MEEPVAASAEAIARELIKPVSINEPPGSKDGSLEPPAALKLSFIDPAEAVIGGSDVEMHAIGEGFTAGTVIMFNGGEEPTTRVSDTDIFTTVKPSTATMAGAFPVTVRRGDEESTSVDFTFTEAAGG